VLLWSRLQRSTPLGFQAGALALSVSTQSCGFAWQLLNQCASESTCVRAAFHCGHDRQPAATLAWARDPGGMLASGTRHLRGRCGYRGLFQHRSLWLSILGRLSGQRGLYGQRGPLDSLVACVGKIHLHSASPPPFGLHMVTHQQCNGRHRLPQALRAFWWLNCSTGTVCSRGHALLTLYAHSCMLSRYSFLSACEGGWQRAPLEQLGQLCCEREAHTFRASHSKCHSASVLLVHALGTETAAPPR
jgi:hypothetical protein